MNLKSPIFELEGDLKGNESWLYFILNPESISMKTLSWRVRQRNSMIAYFTKLDTPYVKYIGSKIIRVEDII